MIQLPHAHLFYAEYQPKDAKRSLVLVHGAGGSHLSWPAELRRLPNTAVYALDLAGHGRSYPPGHSTIAAHAEDVLDLIAALKLERVTVLGHSMGGAVAQLVGLAQPAKVIGLVLAGTGARLRVSPAIVAALQADQKAAVALLNQFYWGGSQDPAIEAANRRTMLACPPQVMLNDFLACDQFDVRDRLAAIDLPTLVISAAADQMTPPKFGQFLADRLPQAEFALIEQAGHMMMLEAPGRVARLVGDFMRKLDEA